MCSFVCDESLFSCIFQNSFFVFILDNFLLNCLDVGFFQLEGGSKYGGWGCCIATALRAVEWNSAYLAMKWIPSSVSSDQFRSVAQSWGLFETPWITARRASLPITNSRSSLRLTSIESVMLSSHLILCRPLLLLPPITLASESFPMSQLFAWGGQSTGASALASFLPKKSQGWSPSEWTGWICLQSKGLSRVFSNTTVQKHQFFGVQLSSQSNSHIHTQLLEKP